jgi:hypothetical protein
MAVRVRRGRIGKVTIGTDWSIEMPWSIQTDVPGCDGFAVVKDATGEVEGCHPTVQDAQAQLAALHIAEAED